MNSLSSFSIESIRNDINQVEMLLNTRKINYGDPLLIRELDKYSLNCVNEKNTSKLINTIQKSIKDPKYLSNKLPKINKLSKLLIEHFLRRIAGGTSTRAIVFTELRISVNEIVAALNIFPGKESVIYVL